MIEQLACPKCGCRLAHFDTDIVKACPICRLPFGAEVLPVPAAQAPPPGQHPFKDPETPVVLSWIAVGVAFFSALFALFDEPRGGRLVLAGMLVSCIYQWLRRSRAWPQQRALLTIAGGLWCIAGVATLCRVVFESPREAPRNEQRAVGKTNR